MSVQINFERYALDLLSSVRADISDDNLRKADTMLRKVCDISASNLSKENDSLINSAIMVYVFIKSVIPEASMIRYESKSRFWIRIDSDRFVMELSNGKLSVYQFVIGELWKETEVSLELMERLNDAAMSYGIF